MTRTINIFFSFISFWYVKNCVPSHHIHNFTYKYKLPANVSHARIYKHTHTHTHETSFDCVLFRVQIPLKEEHILFSKKHICMPSNQKIFTNTIELLARAAHARAHKRIYNNIYIHKPHDFDCVFVLFSCVLRSVTVKLNEKGIVCGILKCPPNLCQHRINSSCRNNNWRKTICG